MTWRELSDFLNLQRRAIVPRPIFEFARIGEKAADTFERLEKATRESLDEAVRGFPLAWPQRWRGFSHEGLRALARPAFERNGSKGDFQNNA